MANGFAMIDESIWRKDREFRALPRVAQAMFLQVLSQKDLDCAGTLTFHVDLLAKGCDEMTVTDVWHDLKTLEQAGFVYTDSDTDELLIRTYARRVSLRGGPNGWKGLVKAARMLVSTKLRAVLADELRRIGRADADDLATEIQPDEPTPSEPPTNPVTTPSEPRSDGIPPSNPLRTPPAVETVVATSPAVIGNGGGSRAHTRTREADTTPPSPCPKHPHGYDHDTPCRQCQRLREYDQTHAAELTRETEHRQYQDRIKTEAAITACRLCDFQGLIDMPELLTDGNHPTQCPHDAKEIVRAKQEILTTRRQMADQ